MTKNNHFPQKQKIDYYSIFVFIIFLGLAFVVYSNILSSPWILDDIHIITANDSLRNNSIFYKINTPRYIGYVTFALNYKINTINPFGYHVVNIIIHAINAFIVFILFRKIHRLLQEKKEPSSQNLIPFCIASLFLLHPIQTQAVTYIVQRFTSLATLFALLSLLLYINFRTSSSHHLIWYILAVVSALLAYKTKENTATIPLMILVIEKLLLKKFAIPWKKLIFYVLPFFLLIVVIPFSFVFLQDHEANNPGSIFSEMKDTMAETPMVSRSQYLVTEFSVIVLYMRLMILPVNQSIKYLYPFNHTFFEPKTFLSFCIIAALILISIIISKKHKKISLGIYWFFIFLLVESSIIPIEDAIFEHRLYLPSIGFISAGVYLLYLLLGKSNSRSFRMLLLIIMTILAIATYKRNEVWRDEFTLWKNVIERFPQDYVAHAQLGNAYAYRDRCDDAIPKYKITLSINPNYVPTHINLARCYLKENLTDDAFKEYYTAIDLDPRSVIAYYGLSILTAKQGNIKEAINLLEKAKTFDNTNAAANAQLARLYCGLGEYEKTDVLFRIALKQQPDNPNTYLSYGVCLMESGKMQEGRKQLFQVINMDPQAPDSYYFLGLSYEKEGDYKNAVSYFTQFILRAQKNNPYMERAKAHLQRLKE